MIEALSGLPEGVLGFRLSGPVSREEYVGVFLPPMRQALDAGVEMRLMLVVGDDFSWFEPGAAWEDLKFGVGHHKGWDRTAIVSDAGWVRHAMGLFGWMMPGEARAFTAAERDEAVNWLAEVSGP
ncbi:STAS/SEC14 domain-containing protein [Actinoplanes sp. CA-054009]